MRSSAVEPRVDRANRHVEPRMLTRAVARQSVQAMNAWTGPPRDRRRALNEPGVAARIQGG